MWVDLFKIFEPSDESLTDDEQTILYFRKIFFIYYACTCLVPHVLLFIYNIFTLTGINDEFEKHDKTLNILKLELHDLYTIR